MEKYVVPSGRNANEIENYIRKMWNNDWLKILMEEVYPPMQACFLSKKWFFVKNSIESDEKIVFGWKHIELRVDDTSIKRAGGHVPGSHI